MASAALIAALLAAEPEAQRETDEPRHVDYVVPALETEAVHFGFLAFSNLVTQMSFAEVTVDAIAAHFDGRSNWAFDTDRFITNQFGHPYQGALSFTAARSTGVSFWVSGLYAFMGSLTWELFFEVDAPSLNDQITTTLGGILLGEVLHRSALLIYDDPTSPRFLRVLFAVLLEPFGAFNRWLFDGRLDESDVQRPAASLAVGALGLSVGQRTLHTPLGEVSAEAGPQFAVEVLYTYGAFDPSAPRELKPLSHFDLSASVSPGDLPLGSLFIRGALLGRQFRATPRLDGVWGLFGAYDYAQPTVFRVSSVGFGPGTSLQWQFSPHGFVQLTALGAFVPFGSIGSLGLDETEARDYHIGLGAAAVVEARVVHSELGFLRAVARQWVVVGAYAPPPGFEAMTQVTVGTLFKLGWHIGAVADAVVTWRVPRYDDDTFNRQARDTALRLSLCYFTDEHFGVLAR